MALIASLLLVLAFACFVLAALGVPDAPRGRSLVSGGLACWVLAEILRGGL